MTVFVLEAIAKIKETEGKKRGVKGSINCPKCNGELQYSIAKLNGHIWGKCKTDKCLKWMM